MPNGVRIPERSMSILPRIGYVHELVKPLICRVDSISPFTLGLNSIMLNGAVSARPALPKTVAISERFYFKEKPL
jgi:hypothetical protein